MREEGRSTEVFKLPVRYSCNERCKLLVGMNNWRVAIFSETTLRQSATRLQIFSIPKRSDAIGQSPKIDALLRIE